ncbi:MAG: hypothetical protein QM728_03485 [Gordonia sp. (in: high G+C Gram-positive bacteria)]|uniref:hypothetical protein n=1 Tax=Gordonia sp. (in: high G+C Gram-positive bacteria) TaxID=84139 RepID=UPI0039E27982
MTDIVLDRSALDLPRAPAVVGESGPRRRRGGPAVALIVLGALLVVAPFALGLFAKVAAGQQLLDRFTPLLTEDSLARYDGDLRFLRGAADTVGTLGATYRVPTGRYPGIAAYRADAADITDRGGRLIDDVRAGAGDFHRLAAVGGFDRLPLLLVAAGLAIAGGGVALLRSDDRGRRLGAVAAGLAGAGLIAFVATSGVLGIVGPADQLVSRFGPIMNEQQVRQLQSDFVTVVGAVGDVDTGYPGVPVAPADAAALNRLKAQWPQTSRDLADLVGQINDNIGNYRSLVQLGRLSPIPGVSGWQLVPAVGLVAGAAALVLAFLAGRPIRKEHTP